MKRWLTITALGIIIIGGSLILESCRKNASLNSSTPINFIVPQGFPPPTYYFQGNPLTEEGFLLGRKLFYDGRLSLDGNFPCASCHQPVAAFTTFEHDRSHGYNNSHTLRNAPGLFNLAWYPVFMQDGSKMDLAEIYRDHITDPTEMAETMDNVISKLEQDDNYKRMFAAAFGNTEISQDRIFKAISQFLINMVSADSKYDKVMRGEATFNSFEQSGYQIFQQHCSTCHKEPLFTDFSFRNVGLELDMNLNDFGRMMVTGNASDSLKFRVPSLRNAEFTSYYTHDGRISLPRLVIQHYRNPNLGPTLDPLLLNGIILTDTEEDHLMAFLRTLSDSAFLNNPRYRE